MMLLPAAMAVALVAPGASEAQRWADLAELYRQVPAPPSSVADAVARRGPASQALKRIYAQLAECERKLKTHQGRLEGDVEAGLRASGSPAGGTTKGKPPAQTGQPASQQVGAALMQFHLQRVPREQKFEAVVEEVNAWVDGEKERRGCETEECEKAVERMGLERKEEALNTLFRAHAQGYRPIAALMETATRAEAAAILALAQKGLWVLDGPGRGEKEAGERVSQLGLVMNLVAHLRTSAGLVSGWFIQALDLRDIDSSDFSDPAEEGSGPGGER